MRRQFSLPVDDISWLEQRGKPYELINDGGVLRVIISGVKVPPGYNVSECDTYVLIDPGYPDSQIDMAYFSPSLVRTDGKAIGATSSEMFDGKSWQRWSRHRTAANPWRPGIDNLATHFELVADWLSRELRKT